MAAGTKSEMPLAVILESANVNEKKAAPRLLCKAAKRSEERWKNLVADTQYSSQAFREEVKLLRVKSVIPYPRNQAKGGAFYASTADSAHTAHQG